MRPVAAGARLCFASLIGLCTACAGARPRAAVTPSPPDSTPSPRIRQTDADTSEQARIGRFFQMYRERAAPFARSGNYLGEIALLRALEDSLGPSPSIHSLVGQQVATYLAFLGRPHQALVLFDSLMGGGSDTASGADLDSLQLEDAVTAIAAIADTARIVMINEAHHVPQGRALTLALLKPLRDRGYAYFAAETFGETDSTLDERGYAVRSTGFYSNEPLFGAVIREALRLGYTLVPYEAVGADGQEARERQQAEHLYERILRDHPDAKVLVHAGYSHINESGLLAGTAPMAVRFREATGIDPVTVDQTTMREHGDTIFERRAYRRLTGLRSITRPSVLRNPETGRLWSARPGVHDVTVIEPRTTYRQGRPDWLWTAGDRRAWPLAPSVCGAAPSCVVLARLENESDEAVPVDALLVEAGRSPAPLLLPPGAYRITATDAAGRTVGDTTAEIR